MVRRHSQGKGKARGADAPDATRAVGRPATRAAAPLAEAFAALPASPFERVALFNALKEHGVVGEASRATRDEDAADLLVGGATFEFEGASQDPAELSRKLTDVARRVGDFELVAGTSSAPSAPLAWNTGGSRGGAYARRPLPPVVEPLRGDPAFADDAARFVRVRDAGLDGDDAIGKAEARRKYRGQAARVRRELREEEAQAKSARERAKRVDGVAKRIELRRAYQERVRLQEEFQERHRDPLPGCHVVEVIGPRMRKEGVYNPHDLLVPEEEVSEVPPPEKAMVVGIPVHSDMLVPKAPRRGMRGGASIALLAHAGRAMPDEATLAPPRRARMAVPPPDHDPEAPPPPEGRAPGAHRPSDDGMTAADRGGALPQPRGTEPLLSHAMARAQLGGSGAGLGGFRGAAAHGAHEQRADGGMRDQVAAESEEAPAFLGGAKSDAEPKGRVLAMQMPAPADEAMVAEFEAKRVTDFEAAAAPGAHRYAREQQAAGAAPRQRHPGLPARRPGWIGTRVDLVAPALGGVESVPSPRPMPRTSLISVAI